MDGNKYEIASSASETSVTDYEMKLSTLIALRGLSHNSKWRLSTDNISAGIFGDIVFESEDGAIMIQCKYEKAMLEDIFQKEDGGFLLHKYYDSFQMFRTMFDTKLLIICSNVGPDKTILDIFEEDEILVPVFPRGIVSYRLKESKMNYVNTCLTTSAEFWKKFRLFHISDEELDECIDTELATVEQTSGLEFNKSNFTENITEWFSGRNATFIEKSHVKAFLYGWRSQSHLKNLDSFGIDFEQYYVFKENIKVVNIVSVSDHFLIVLKAHRSLHITDSMSSQRAQRDSGNRIDKKQIFYVDFEEVSDEIIESFELPSFNILIISLMNFDKYSKIHDILTRYPYKKAIIVSKESIQTNFSQTDVIRDEICFTDLTETSRTTLLSKNIKFQGQDLSLGEVTKNSLDLNSSIDQRTIVDLIHGEVIEIGNPIENLKETSHFYMNRQIHNFDRTLGERNITSFLQKTEKIILILGPAGMGKTTYLTSLGCSIKKEYPHLFLIRVDLNKMSRKLETFIMEENNAIKLEDFIEVGHRNLELNVMSMPDEVVLMIDAVDEICPSYRSLIYHFIIQAYEHENILKIVVTTRPYLMKDLYSFVNYKTYQLLPYTEREQIEFLKKYWKEDTIDSKNIHSRAKKLLTELNSATGNIFRNFTGIPLHLNMIAEIFQREICCEGILASKNERTESIVPDKLDTTKLYDMFIQKKAEIFTEGGSNEENITVKEILSNLSEEVIIEHKKLAAQAFFTDEQCFLLHIFKKDSKVSEKTILKVGIIQEVDDKLSFVHRSFAEYFVAKTLWAELKEMNFSREFLVFLLGSVFIEDSFETVRPFFENILIHEWDQIPEEVFVVCGSTVDTIAWDRTKNFNILAREGRLNMLKLMLEKSDNTNHLFEIGSNKLGGRTIMFSLIKDWHVETIEKDIVYQIIEFLISKGADINQKDDHGRTFMHFAVEWDEYDLIKFCFLRGADIEKTDNNGNTVMLYAGKRRRLGIAKFCLKNGSDINHRDNDGLSLFLYAARNYVLSILNFCMKYGADPHQEDDLGCTVMHYAEKTRNSELMNYCIEKGANQDHSDDKQ